MAAKKPPARRICRTADEAFAAGWEDAKADRPLSVSEAARVATLLRPYLAEQPRRTA